MSNAFRNNIKNIRTMSPDYKLFAGGDCPEHILNSLQCQFAIKSLLSVLLSSSTARNFNNSRPMYAILWEMINNYRTIWFMKNSKCQHFLFLKKSAQKLDKFFNFLPSKGRHFSITKLDILIFGNLLHLEMGFWNLSWKKTVSS